MVLESVKSVKSVKIYWAFFAFLSGVFIAAWACYSFDPFSLTSSGDDCGCDISATSTSGTYDKEITKSEYDSWSDNLIDDYTSHLPAGTVLDEDLIKGKWGGKITVESLRKLICNTDQSDDNQTIEFKYGLEEAGSGTKTYLMFYTPGYTNLETGDVHPELCIRTGQSEESFCPVRCVPGGDSTGAL